MKNFKYILALLVLCIAVDAFAQNATHPLDNVSPAPKIGNIIFGQQVQCNSGGTYDTEAGDVTQDQCGCIPNKQSDKMLWDGAVAADNSAIEPVSLNGSCNKVQHRIYPLEVAISDLESRACHSKTYAYTLGSSSYWCKAKIGPEYETRTRYETCDSSWKDNECDKAGCDENRKNCPVEYQECVEHCDCDGSDSVVYDDGREEGVASDYEACWRRSNYDKVTWHSVCSEDAGDDPRDTPEYTSDINSGSDPRFTFTVTNVLGAAGDFELVPIAGEVTSTLEGPTDGVDGSLLADNTESRWDYYCYSGDDIYIGPTSPLTCGANGNEECQSKIYGPYETDDCANSVSPLIRQQRYFLQRKWCEHDTGVGCDLPLGPYKVSVTVNGLHGTTLGVSSSRIPLDDSDYSTTTWDDRPTVSGVGIIPGPGTQGVDTCDINSSDSGACLHEGICANIDANSTITPTRTLDYPMEGRIAEVAESGTTIAEQVYFIRGVSAEISRPNGEVYGEVVENYDGADSQYSLYSNGARPGVITQDQSLSGVDGAYDDEMDTDSGGFIRFGGSQGEQTADLFAIDTSIYVSSLRSLKKKTNNSTDVMPISPYAPNNAANTADLMKSLGDTVNYFTENGGGTEGYAWCSGVSQAVNVLRKDGCDESDDKCVLFIAVTLPPVDAYQAKHQMNTWTKWGSNFNSFYGSPDEQYLDRVGVVQPTVTTTRQQFYDCVEQAVQPLKDEKGKVIVIGLNPAGDGDFERWVKDTSTDDDISSATGVHSIFIGDGAEYATDANGNTLVGTEADLAAETLWAIMPKPIEICQGPGGC